MKKVLLGALTGGIVFFFLGWLIYGILLMNFAKTNYNNCSERPMEEMVWWAMILSNLASGFLLSLVYYWTKSKGVLSGAKIGGIVGLLLAISMDLSMYSMSTMFLNITAMLVDIIVYTFMMTVSGILIAWVMGFVKAKD